MYGRAWVAAVVEALLPSACLVCGEPVELAHRGLCGGCWRGVGSLIGDRCPRCAGPADGDDELCLDCAETAPPQHGTVAWGEHAGSLRRAVLAMKHHGRDELAGALADRLAARVAMQQWSGELSLVTAVPSHPWHRLRRGYTAAELLARHLAHTLALPYRRTLGRRRRDRQAARSRPQRLVMPRGAFRARFPLGDERVLLVDDVTTTGTTLRRAASALLAAGAAAVYCGVLAYSPDPRRM